MADTLTEFQKELLKSFDPKKNVRFEYNIVDCEHEGDIRSAENEVNNYIIPLGGQIITTFWDGNDCGEAYIICEIPFSQLEKVFKDNFFRYDPYQK